MAKTKSAYAQKLLDPRWQRKRLEILQRDGWKCNHCHAEDKPLQVHHAYYDFGLEPWEYPNYSLQVLCEPCHEQAEWCRQWLKRFIPCESLRHQSTMVEFATLLSTFPSEQKDDIFDLILIIVQAMRMHDPQVIMTVAKELSELKLRF